jgi:hypothetical protein
MLLNSFCVIILFSAFVSFSNAKVSVKTSLKRFSFFLFKFSNDEFETLQQNPEEMG